jgi:hypothetical protein
MIAATQQIPVPCWLFLLLVTLSAAGLGFWFVQLFHWFVR